tara:strand:+ start:66730 stop:66999 length:270 start_codon:yes stop_codon:yes gene_type:complete
MNVIIPTSLRQHTGGSSSVAVSGDRVEIALRDLVAQHPSIRTHLIDESGEPVSHVNIFVNDENIRDLDGGATPVHPRDEILVVPAIAGG